ncbi:MAG: hypothetical protein BGO70_03580 [Bacteroidetes bacterium 43-93]|nr:3-deoxy-manno-octulosonate cytidylyltransferase [Bacteroidota bacterium]OJW98975.1 MAG: hypothetical protein BGO70_03580 [Bacteroidetes bacterium 43-93]
MKVVAMISACLQSPGFSDKLLSVIKGVPLITRTYKAAVSTGLFSDVIVVTDDKRIEEEIKKVDGKAVLTKHTSESGLEGIAKVAALTDADFIVYVQGNIPFIEGTAVQKLLQLFEGNMGKNIEAASMVQKLQAPNKIDSTYVIKAILDLRLFAIYFSRAPIPFIQDKTFQISHYAHIGIYAFRKDLMLKILGWPMSPLEHVENIEALRLVENGVHIKMMIDQSHQMEVNTTADIAEAEALIEKMGWE